MKRIVFGLSLLASSPLFATVTCTTLDGSAYTQDQLNLVPSLAYSLGAAQNSNVQPPTVSQANKQLTICFTDPSFTVATVITTTTLTNQYTSDQAARAAGAAQAAAWQTELSTTTAAVIAGYNNFGSLTQAQINGGVKNIVRIFWLRQLLGLDAQ